MDLTREDLREVAEDLKGYIQERCDRIELRQDTANGKLMKHERELGEHHAKIKGIEHELYNSLVEVEEPVADEDGKPALTKRDLKILGSLVVGTGVVLEAARAAWEFFRAVHP
jgi:hypothetical protein